MREPLISINPDLCVSCYACVRVCPVNAIYTQNNIDPPVIIDERCVGCGSCLGVCAPDAIDYRSSTQLAKTLLDSPSKVAALVAPSISGEFDDITDYRKFVSMIRALGFDYVNEVSFGVDLVARKYHDLFTNFMGKYYIMANCPPIVKIIEKYFPELIDNLAPIVTPMIASAQVARKLYGDDVKVVYIGPCIGAKDEDLDQEGNRKVDAVLTFVELREMFAANGIKESTVEFSDFDPPLGYKGSLYAVSNGIIQAAELDEDLMRGKIITADGKHDILEGIREFDASIDFIKKHFNLFYCEGCLMGPGTSKGGKKYLRTTLVTDYANKKLKGFDVDYWKEVSDEHYSQHDLAAHFKPDDQRIPTPPEEEVNEVLARMNKTLTPGKQGCGSCGFASCHEFAINVAKGLVKEDMCMSHSLRSKQDYINTLKVTNEKLASTQEALQESELTARHEKEKAQEALDRTSGMLQKLPSAVVIIDKNLKVVESNPSFIEMLGDEAREVNEVVPGLIGANIKTLLPAAFIKLVTAVFENKENLLNKDVTVGEKLLNVSVFPLQKGELVGAVIRDMYLPEVRKEEVISRVTEVIDENLDLVQKIAFLLGEGASKTERMLNSIIESHKQSNTRP